MLKKQAGLFDNSFKPSCNRYQNLLDLMMLAKKNYIVNQPSD